MYRDLITNLPTILMGDPTFPWSNDWRTESFPHHTEFRNYFQKYWNEALDESTKRGFCFETEVTNVVPASPGYEITTQDNKTEHFDQVIVSTGHFDRPFVPSPLNMLYEDPSRRDKTVYHSKNWDSYRDSLKGRDVVLVGFGPSGVDLGGFLSKIARTLHWVHSSFEDLPDNQDDIKFWTRLQSREGHGNIRLSRKGEIEDLYVANDIDSNNLAIIFATVCWISLSLLSLSLRRHSRHRHF